MTTVTVAIGDIVKKDHLLAKVESSDLDYQYTQAQLSLESVRLDYEKMSSNQNRELLFMKAQSTYNTAKSALTTIADTIRIKNNEEDVAVAKAQYDYSEAKKEYDELAASRAQEDDAAA